MSALAAVIDHLLVAHQSVSALSEPFLKLLVGMALLEAGRMEARRLARDAAAAASAKAEAPAEAVK